MRISMLRRRLQRLRDKDERGSILILVVLSTLIIVGSAGLAVDVGRLYAAKAELSRAVDARRFLVCSSSTAPPVV